MEKISLTYFVDFVFGRWTPKLTGVREFKERKDELYTDFTGRCERRSSTCTGAESPPACSTASSPRSTTSGAAASTRRW